MGVVVTFLVVGFTFPLNKGAFSFGYYDAVVIMFSSHGHFFWFVTTATAGSFLILFLAKITPFQKTMVWMGQNTLILMCLNGIFYHYINFRVAEWFLAHFSGSFWAVLGVGCGMTLVSMVACIPLIHGFNTFVPQVVGKPKMDGPWLKKMI